MFFLFGDCHLVVVKGLSRSLSNHTILLLISCSWELENVKKFPPLGIKAFNRYYSRDIGVATHPRSETPGCRDR